MIACLLKHIFLRYVNYISYFVLFALGSFKVSKNWRMDEIVIFCFEIILAVLCLNLLESYCKCLMWSKEQCDLIPVTSFLQERLKKTPLLIIWEDRALTHSIFNEGMLAFVWALKAWMPCQSVHSRCTGVFILIYLFIVSLKITIQCIII